LGTIVITRHVGVADDIIHHGENGFFFENEEDLLNLLIKIVPDYDLCKRVSKNSLQNRSVFTWEDVCKQHALRVYQHLLPAPPIKATYRY
jgi:glycosyltransferase involved in cell wall biosynthesis